MDDFRLYIALIALGLSFWNFSRLRQLDEKTEYKDKRSLYKECLDEAKALLEKIETELVGLQSDRSCMVMRGSSYLGSAGADSGFSNVVDVIGQIDSLRNDVKGIYESLGEVPGMDDKEAFDECVRISAVLKRKYVEAIEKLSLAKLKTSQLLQAEQSYEASKA